MDEPQDTAEEERGDLRIGYLSTSDALPLLYAKEHGLFEDDSLIVELVPFKAHMDIDTALVGGSIDAALSEIIRLEALKKKYGTETTAILKTDLKWTLISNKSAKINKLSQFSDKTIAMTRFSATDSLCELTFKKVKTKEPWYKVQINNVELRWKMLENNELDAAWLPEPYATIALEAGHEKVAEPDTIEWGVLAARKDYAERYGERLEKVKRIYELATDSIK